MSLILIKVLNRKTKIKKIEKIKIKKITVGVNDVNDEMLMCYVRM